MERHAVGDGWRPGNPSRRKMRTFADSVHESAGTQE